jgi:hypothetical protein
VLDLDEAHLVEVLPHHPSETEVVAAADLTMTMMTTMLTQQMVLHPQ